ncbi:DoxX family protein [Cellulomonas sp. NPDC058312]|uniref:DoxX family protein n=1 Tax=Cellulomonas sp. NPDC058312 TaxID=3346441 RepID=UPI0036E4393B
MHDAAPARRRLTPLVWIPQLLVVLVFAGGGAYKLVTPYADVVEQFGDIPQGLVVTASVLEVIGGIGVLLPTLTRILPGLTVWAALGCALLQAGAVVFHVTAGDTDGLALNAALIVLSLSVAWLRWRVAPVAPVRPRRA